MRRLLFSRRRFTPQRFIIINLGLAVAAGIVLGEAGHAQDLPEQAGEVQLAKWRGGSGVWSNHLNWVPLGPPGLSELPFHVMIDSGNPLASAVDLDLNATVARLTIDADDALTIASGRVLTADSPFDQVIVSNAGTLRCNGETDRAALSLSADTICELNGGGAVVLDHQWQSVINADTGTATLINANQTIRGEGRIGEGTLELINYGEIRADRPFRQLIIRPSNDGCTNSGMMTAAQNGVLRLAHGAFFNEEGVIRAEESAFVDLNDMTLIGGELLTEPGGYIRMFDAPVAWDNLTFGGQAILGPTQLRLTGTITNHGVINVVGDLALGGGYDATSEILIDAGDGPVHLDGSGTLNLLSCQVRSADGQNATLINGESHTIVGEGLIGSGGPNLVNDGLVRATGTVSLVFHPGSGRCVRNNGTMRADGLGGIVLATGRFHNDGVVEIQPSSRLLMMPGVDCENLSGGMLLSGTWRVIGDASPTTIGFVGPTISTNLADVTLSGSGAAIPRLTGLNHNGGILRLEDGQAFAAGPNFVNTGVLDIGPTASLSSATAFVQTPSATLRIGLNINAAGEVVGGRVSTGITATLNGILDVQWLADAPTPHAAVIPILQAPAVNGQFSAVNGPLGMTVIYGSNGVYVLLLSLASDDGPSTPHDETVAIELIELLDHFGPCEAAGAPCSWDLTEDGCVDADDVLVWLAINE